MYVYRWTVGAYRGSGADKVQALCGLNDVGVVMHNKGFDGRRQCRYARHLPELRGIGEPILNGVVEGDIELHWMQGLR